MCWPINLQTSSSLALSVKRKHQNTELQKETLAVKDQSERRLTEDEVWCSGTGLWVIRQFLFPSISSSFISGAKTQKTNGALTRSIGAFKPRGMPPFPSESATYHSKPLLDFQGLEESRPVTSHITLISVFSRKLPTKCTIVIIITTSERSCGLTLWWHGFDKHILKSFLLLVQCTEATQFFIILTQSNYMTFSSLKFVKWSTFFLLESVLF